MVFSGGLACFLRKLWVFQFADPQDLYTALLKHFWGNHSDVGFATQQFFNEVFGRKDSISYSMHALEKYKSLVGPS